MKISVSSAVYGMEPLDKIIFRAAELGYDAVELTGALHIPVETSAERRKTVRGWIQSAGIECSALHYIWDGSVKMATADKDEMKRCTDYLCKVIDMSSDMESRTVIVGSGGKTRSFEDDQDRSEVTKNMAEIIFNAGEYAKDKGVILAMEAINRYETNFLNTLKEAVEFTKMVNHPNVRTMADTYHMNIEEVSPADEIRKYGHTLANIHFADSNRQAPGEGHFDFVSLAQALKKVNFSEYISFEVFGLYPWKLWFDTFEEADSQMERGIKYVRNLFK
ncbi:sugar phosphate isomerase/epimerase family protein [Ohessyouella blattaphilus]|uniref:Sugar phosphate isomerase/epimerase n=2 Tax=Bacteria TaxID=2 RepID=A0ABT1EKB6_9FIRM|nr:sugar phosphate isomerase/epimerase family protein [Ohessyouella blattaphilus]MCP1111145.1 sugar phosphate isomerase/epimerase [Ohessyouella blattaphilus]MCR8564539.1 sugar phosphate isomerase/epimerase [Ohessyouella blattaphilus]